MGLEQWVAKRKAARQLKEFEKIEKHLRLARYGVRKVRTDAARQANVNMVKDLGCLLVDLQIYKRDVGVLQDEHLRREIARVRGGGFHTTALGSNLH